MSSRPTITHVGFSDESSWNVGRFRSLALVTLQLQHLQALQDSIRALLVESSLSEFEWKKLDGAKERFAAIKLCGLAVTEACAGRLRVDVVVWDIEDSRHRIRGRDDIENLARMYYHLFRNVMRARWPNDAIWRFHPDEQTAIDWEIMGDCLQSVSVSMGVDGSLLNGGGLKLRLRKEFSIEEIAPTISVDAPVVQVADLFAGLAVFSRTKHGEFTKWKTEHDPQLQLWQPSETAQGTISAIARERFLVLEQFNDRCKAKKLGVSLTTKRGLWTPRPQDPLNFWLYQPRHELDKAPRRDGR
jgi:hypothetical protein